MTIDYTTIRLYTCCKCGNMWTNWDSKNKEDGRIPLNCPSCRNVRWNHGYTKEDLILVEQLEEQHMIKKDAEIKRSEPTKYHPCYESRHRYLPPNMELKWNHFDFIAYDFLYMMLPQPEIYEIKQVLSIQKSRMEQRHDLMLSMIHNRIRNAEQYEKEHFSKSGTRLKRSLWDMFGGTIPMVEIARRRMKGCKHEEDLEIITALYKKRYYYDGREEFEIYEPERLPGSEAVEAQAEARIKAAYEEQKAERIKKLQSKESEAEAEAEAEAEKVKIEAEVV